MFGSSVPLQRQLVPESRLRIVEIAGEDGQRGVFVRPPGQRRRDLQMLVPDVLHLGVGIAGDAGEPVQQRPVLVERPAEVERPLHAAEGAGLQLNLMHWRVGRPLADQIYDPGR